MSVVKQAGAWLRRDPYRIYLIATILAVLPLTLFVLAAHKLFLRQLIAQSVAQSSHQGRAAGLIIEQHLNEQKVFLESVALRPDLLRKWQQKDYEGVSATLSELQDLRSDLLGVGICEVDGTLRAVVPAADPGSIGQNYATRPWYIPVTSTWKSYVSPVFRSPRPG